MLLCVLSLRKFNLENRGAVWSLMLATLGHPELIPSHVIPSQEHIVWVVLAKWGTLIKEAKATSMYVLGLTWSVPGHDACLRSQQSPGASLLPSRQTYSNCKYSLVFLTAATPSLDEYETAIFFLLLSGESSITLKEHYYEHSHRW